MVVFRDRHAYVSKRTPTSSARRSDPKGTHAFRKKNGSFDRAAEFADGTAVSELCNLTTSIRSARKRKSCLLLRLYRTLKIGGRAISTARGNTHGPTTTFCRYTLDARSLSFTHNCVAAVSVASSRSSLIERDAADRRKPTCDSPGASIQNQRTDLYNIIRVHKKYDRRRARYYDWRPVMLELGREYPNYYCLRHTPCNARTGLATLGTPGRDVIFSFGYIVVQLCD